VTGLAVVLALAVAQPAVEAPESRVVRVDGDDDARLAGLTEAIRAELAAAGLTVVLAPLATADRPEAAAVVRLRLEDDRATVTATAAGVETWFEAAIKLAGPTGTERRVADDVALQVAEWLAAVWLPTPVMVRSPPPLEATASLAPVATAATPGLKAPSSVFLDAGAGILRTPALGTRFGPEIGVAWRGSAPVLAGANPFARLSLAYLWLGSAAYDYVSERFDLRYGTLAISGGLERRLSQNWSAELNAGVGLTLVWFVIDAFPPPDVVGDWFRTRGHSWTAAPAAALGIVRRLSERSSLALEGRARWLVPNPGFITYYDSVGATYWPAVSIDLAIRTRL
jgi:hypothetical protein